MWTINFLMFKLVLEKAEEPEIKLPTPARSWKKQESSRKTSISALLTLPKLLTVWITINCGKFWKRWEYQTTLRNLYAGQETTVRTEHGTTDWFHIGKGVRQGCILSPCLFNLYMQKAMATHSSTVAWKIPWMEEPGRLQSMRSLRVRHDWATSLSLFTFMRWRRKWQPTPVFLPGESQGRGSLVGCRLWGRTELDTTEAT